jgi:hypothetical protein
MRLIKLFVPAALAAVIAIAVPGTSTASAAHTALCKQNEALCSEANLVEHVHLSSNDATFLANFIVPIELICAEVSALLHVKGAALASPLNMSLLELQWIDCETTSGESCEFSATSLGTILVLGSAADRQLGTVQFHGTSMNLRCGALIDAPTGAYRRWSSKALATLKARATA